MLRIATFNVNGIRAAVGRGMDQWLKERDCDILALQEVRCPVDALPRAALDGYAISYAEGDRAGRNGVAILTRSEPVAVRVGFGNRTFDSEGRYIEVDLAPDPRSDRPGLTVGSLYLPKGDTPYDPLGVAKHQRKVRFLTSFGRYLTRARRTAQAADREFLVMGDFNIAHAELDLTNWRTSKRASGFLPDEREWMGSILSPRTLTDVVRQLRPDEPGPYSWWTWRGQAFANNTGWRIDYHLATPKLAAAAVTGGTERADTYEERMSDHAPVVVDYDI